MQIAGKHVARIFGSTLCILVVAFSLLLTIAAQAGMLGIPLAAILLSWFGKYVFVIIDAVAHGFVEPPVLSLDMVAPLSNWRGLALVAISGTVWLSTGWLESAAGTILAVIARTIGLLALPACVAILALESNPLKALNPVALARVAIGLGWWYALLIGALFAAVVCVYLIAIAPLWLMVRIALDLSLVAALSWVLGLVLYRRRAELGIEAWRSPERSAARAAREDDRQHAHFLDEVFALARNGSHANAWRAIEQRLMQAHHADGEYDWLLEGLRRLEDPRHLDRLRNDYLERLVSGRRGADGLKTLERIWRAAPDFRPRDAATTLTLARTALDAGTRRDARILLGDFAQRFAGHPSVPLAQALSASLTRDR